jgi:hypothetical protein
MNPPSSFSRISYRNNDDFYHPIGHHRFGECHTSYQSRPNNNQDLTTTKTEARQSNEHKIP